MRKTQAIEDEDYDTAKLLKQDLERVTRDLMTGKHSQGNVPLQDNPMLHSLNQIQTDLGQVEMNVESGDIGLKDYMLNQMDN